MTVHADYGLRLRFQKDHRVARGILQLGEAEARHVEGFGLDPASAQHVELGVEVIEAQDDGCRGGLVGIAEQLDPARGREILGVVIF
jgi:hypothetical protein